MLVTVLVQLHWGLLQQNGREKAVTQPFGGDSDESSRNSSVCSMPLSGSQIHRRQSSQQSLYRGVNHQQPFGQDLASVPSTLLMHLHCFSV